MKKYIYSELTYREIPKKNITFFKKGLTDKQKRSIIDRVGKRNDCEVVILEDLSYPIGMVGYMKDNGSIRVVYEQLGMIKDIMKQLKCSEEDAWDWYGFNTIRGCSYCYTSTAPCPEIIFYSEEKISESIV